MSKNLDLSLALVRDAAASRGDSHNSIDEAVGAICRALHEITSDETDSDTLLEKFTIVAASALVAIEHLIETEQEED